MCVCVKSIDIIVTKITAASPCKKSNMMCCDIYRRSPSHTLTHILSASSLNRCGIRFLPSRVQMQSMHYAVDHLDLDTIFPSSQTTATNSETSPSIKKCLQELKKSKLYNAQQNAIVSMLNPACTQVGG